MEYAHDNVAKFRIGDVVVVNISHDPQHAWIVGLDLNEKNEVIFAVRYAHDSGGACSLVHPVYVSKLPTPNIRVIYDEE